MIELKNATDAEIVSGWNVLQFSLRMIGDKSDLQGKINSVSEELTSRGIPHEVSKKIIKVA